MILVDTSAWVDYLRDRRTVAAKALTALIDQGAELATTEPVIMELLAGGDTPVLPDSSYNDRKLRSGVIFGWTS